MSEKTLLQHSLDKPRRAKSERTSGLTAGSRFLRACLRQPVDQTPVWFLRQAGRYMPEYQAVRRHHSLLQICKNPELAAEVTITAAEKLDVDAAIIFADLLLPLEGMGLDFEFLAGEGPVIHHPVRTAGDVENLRIDRAQELGYVAEAIRKVVAHFNDRIGIIGFCGAPFTLASYMIEGGGSRNYIHTKSLMYREPSVWRLLLEKLASVLAEFAAQQVEAGADVIQIFDSWAGALSPTDYRDFVLPVTTRLVHQVQALGVPVIYFGVDTATLLPAMRETGADVIGLDWRVPLDQGWSALGHAVAVQGNLDPILLFAERRSAARTRAPDPRAGRRPSRAHLQSRAWHRSRHAGRKCAARWSSMCASSAPSLEGIPVPELAPQRHAVLLLAHGTPESLDQIPEYLRNITGGRPMPESVIEEIRHRYSLIGSSPLTELTLEQGRLLSQALDLPVYVGMRNWKPYIADVVRQMREDGITSAVAICLAPQNSRTSVGLYRRAAFAEAAGAIEIDFIDGWADHPQLAQAFAERLQPVWQGLSARIGSMAPVLFTAHSVPCRTIQASEGPADPYPVEAKRTAANVAALLAPFGLTAADWFFAFQSQGMSGGHLDRSHRRGHPHRAAPGRPLRGRDPAHRLPLRPCRDPLRHRYRLSRLRGRNRP